MGQFTKVPLNKLLRMSIRTSETEKNASAKIDVLIKKRVFKIGLIWSEITKKCLQKIYLLRVFNN